MGKLTDSLNATSRKLEEIKDGIHQMQELGQELADNTLVVAQAALRTGYAYAQAEAAAAPPTPAGTSSSASALLLDGEHLRGEPRWTELLLRKRFKTLKEVSQYLQEQHGITQSFRKWAQAVDTFNGQGGDRHSSPPSLEHRVLELEQQIAQQAHRIQQLESTLERVMGLLQASC